MMSSKALRALINAQSLVYQASQTLVTELPRVEDDQDIPHITSVVEDQMRGVVPAIEELKMEMKSLVRRVVDIERMLAANKKAQRAIVCARIVSGPVRVVQSGADCAAFLAHSAKDSTRTLVFRCTPGTMFSLQEVRHSKGGSMLPSVPLPSKPFSHQGVTFHAVNLLGIADERALAEGETFLRAVDPDHVSAPFSVSLALDSEDSLPVDELLAVAISAVSKCAPA